jgi:hypothetical protein
LAVRRRAVVALSGDSSATCGRCHGWCAAGRALPSGTSDALRVLLKAAIVKPVLEVADGARKLVAETLANYYVHAIMNSEFLPVAG